MLYVFDMDGVLFRMDDPLPAASETVGRLQARGDAVYYLTNNSSKSRADYVEKLARFDIQAREEEIMTSAYALGKLFVSLGASGRRVYVVGEQGLKDELLAVGMNLVEYDDEAQIDFVVSGWDRQFSYAKMTNAHLAIARGAQFIATNRDATYPDAGNRTLPGSGAIVASIETCTGVTPTVIGKPEPYTLELILEMSGHTPDQCVVIGDRLDTDIAIGNRVGAKTILVLTGVSTREEAQSAQDDLKPDVVFKDLSGLLREV
jgi:phosphoglycolate/pyridoxal phosphate phosphatase family enzyme